MNRIIAGTMTWGTWGRNFTRNEMASLIQKCVDLGLTTFDHADIYGGYTTEEAFGHGFKSSGVSRNSVIHITKCGIQYPCEQRPLAVKHYDYSTSHITASVEQSLRNLQTDYIDLLLLHRPSPLLAIDEVVAAIESLLGSGKIKSFGVSNFTPSQIEMLKTVVDVKWNQIECSLSQSTPMFDGSLDYHQTKGIQTMAWSPLGNYFSENRPSNPKLDTLMNELKEKYNASADQLLLAWLLQHPAQLHPVVGTTRIERLAKAKETPSITLTRDDWFLMLERQNGAPLP